MRTLVLSLLVAGTVTLAGAGPMNRHTDWFQQAGYGLFVHYLHGLQNSAASIQSLGRETGWDEAVREFDTERFAEAVKASGAGYAVFTVMQISRHLIAPNATFDRLSGYRPGEACATRDLIEDLYQSLHARGIPLLLYYTGDGPRGDAKAGPAFGWGEPVSTQFVTNWAAVAREWGERYGDKIAGYWVDGCYPWIGYDDAKLALFAAALKAGNPRRIVAFNRGVDARVMAYTRHEDYTCGEQNTFVDLPEGRWVNGEQWHMLAPLGPTWGQPGLQLSKADLAEYVAEVHAAGGVVTVDVTLFRDGGLDRSQVEALRAVRAELSRAKPRGAVPAGNLAWRKPAALLSLDGSHELSVNSGTHYARLGVDGKLSTVALAGGEWPWSFQVDLQTPQALGRIKVTFGSGWATRFEFRVSVDGTTWRTVASRDGHNGQPFEATFAPVTARFVRVSALKPDGPDQPGTQMSIAQLEVYAP